MDKERDSERVHLITLSPEMPVAKRENQCRLFDAASQPGVMDPTQSILIGKEMKQWHSDFKCKAQEILGWLFS